MITRTKHDVRTRSHQKHTARISELITKIRNSLTKKEFLEFAELLDTDGEAGDLWETVQKNAAELAPELFVCDEDKT